MGISTDLYPLTAPQLLARRDHITSRRKEEEEQSIASAPVNDEAEQKAEDFPMQKTESLRADLKAIMRSLKLRPVANGRQQTANYNANVKPEKLAEHQDVFAIEWVDDDAVKGDVLTCKKAEKLASFSGKTSGSTSKSFWRRFEPFKAGHLNLQEYTDHYGASAAREAILTDLQIIWTNIITSPREADQEENVSQQLDEFGLGIPVADWKYYNVILIIPNLYSIGEIEALMELLLDTMGFAAVMLQQEGVCTTFGAGLSSSCVVHLGSQHISVACVDEGLVLSESRIALSYGSDDISQFFMDLLRQSNFPYQDFDYSRKLADRWLANELKERLCTLDPMQLGLIISDFHVRLPSKQTLKYSLRTYDEIILGPMSLFTPGAFGQSDHIRSIQSKFRTTLSNEDENEEEDLESKQGTLAMQNCVRNLLPPETSAGSASTLSGHPHPSGEESGVNSSQGTPAPTSSGPATSTKEATTATTAVNGNSTKGEGSSTSRSVTPSNVPSQAQAEDDSERSPAASKDTSSKNISHPVDSAETNHRPFQNIDVPVEAGKTPLDFAIWNSIVSSVASIGSAATSEERLRRMVTNIFCSGGAARLPGLGYALEARLNNYITLWYSSQQKDVASAPNAVVIPPPRDMDPRVVSWKGTAVLSRLDSAQDLWVLRPEWQTFGLRSVREKCFWM